MAAEALKGFPKTIQTALREGNTTYAAKLFRDEKYASEVKNNSWDLIPVITEHLTEENRYKNDELFKCCVKLLGVIGEYSNPEEALLQFVSEIEESKENLKFIVLLDPLYKLILRISPKDINSLAWSLDAIQTYLGKCAVPDYKSLEGKERLLIENNDIVRNIIRLYREVIVFYKNCVCHLTKENNEEIKNVLCKFLVQLLGNPLCYLTMEEFGSIKTDGGIIAEDIVKKVFTTTSDPFLLIEKYERERDVLLKPDILSLANLFYLIYHEGISIEIVPKVYNSIHLFKTHLRILPVLLEQSNRILIEKGLKLAHSAFAQVKDQNLSYMLLDCEDHIKFCKALANIIVYNESQIVRQTALRTFGTYLKLFEIKGLYLIVFNLMSILTHSGLIGYTITFYKDVLSKEFKNSEDNIPAYFKGPKLFRILRKFCFLREKEQSNLLESSDQIISVLNFLRYLALRDINNLTQIWDFFSTLEEIYFQPLRRGIELSRAHYELEIKKLNEEKDCYKKKNDISITVGEKKIQAMGQNERLEVLNSSLTAYDVIDSLLNRVTELTENKIV